MTSRETARQGKGEDGRARTREVKLAVFFTQDRLGKEGNSVRDRDSTSVIATFEQAGTFADLVKAEGIRRGADHVRQLTILGDGAAWIWGIATAKFPEATQIVNLYHAREHLHDLARKLEFMLGGRRQIRAFFAGPQRIFMRDSEVAADGDRVGGEPLGGPPIWTVCQSWVHLSSWAHSG